MLISQIPVTSLYFSYPGRNSPLDKKHAVKRAIIEEIRNAKISIVGYIYSFNDFEIISELADKKKQGVKIELFGDADTDYEECHKLGIDVKIWKGSGIHHTKIWFFDETKMFLGTGNFTSHGLERDHNVYWKQNVINEEYLSLRSELDQSSNRGTSFIGGGIYHISPQSGRLIQDNIIESIYSAKESVRYLIFSHFDPLISYALLDQARKGIRVEGIYNHPVNPEGSFLAKELPFPSAIYKEGNEDVLFENENFYGGLLHHKTMIIDSKEVLVGSYNYSVSARDKNLEFFTNFSHPWIVEEFISEFERIKENSQQMEKSEPFSENLTSLYVKKITNPIFSSYVLRRKNGSLDSNSSALANELAKLSEFSGYPQIFGSNRFHVEESGFWNWLPNWNLLSGRIWIQDLFATVKIHSESRAVFHRIEVWDGNEPPKVFYPTGPNIFSKTLVSEVSNFRWIVMDSDLGQLNSCSVKRGIGQPNWLSYLKRKFYQKNKIWLECVVL
ncbi:MAG: phospholipase D-like domain-containing protein [Leptospira sp.]|nr:phospholipase D-like domain-containing protein [Leptospira sp.]